MSLDAATATTQLEEWRRDLEELYREIGEWLGEMEPKPHWERRPITLNERRSGPYTVDEMVITHKEHHMEVRPIARWVVGADGRVDLTGTQGPFVLVLLRDEGGWHYVPDRATGELAPLTGELFRRLVGLGFR